MENNRVKKRARNFPEQYLDYERDWRDRDLRNNIGDANKRHEVRTNGENTSTKSAGGNKFIESLRQK